MTPASAGLQRERTALAWERTAVALLVVAAAAARLATTRSPAVALVLVAVVLPVGLLCSWRCRAACQRPRATSSPRAAALGLCASVAGLGLLDLIALLR